MGCLLPSILRRPAFVHWRYPGDGWTVPVADLEAAGRHPHRPASALPHLASGNRNGLGGQQV